MSGFDWKKLVGTVAPVLGTALGGPFGGMATKAIADAILTPGDAEATPLIELPGKIADALETNAEAVARLAAADQAFNSEMLAIGVDIMELDAADRADARQMQIKNKTLIVPILAGITVAAFFGVVFWVLTGKVTLESTLLGFILGQVSSKAEQVYNYFFGSSQGSKNKEQILSNTKAAL